MKIILAIDGSEHSKLTVEGIAGQPFPPKTEVRIVTVYTKPSKIVFAGDGMMSEDYNPEINQVALKSTTNITKDATKILHKDNPKLIITSAVFDGFPAHVIIQEAETFGAGLIVVGSHGHGAVAGFLLGSVSQAVALHAKCSVEIVRNGKQKKMKILLATDGSAHSMAMIKQFAGRTFAPNTKVHIISVCEIYPYRMNISPMGPFDEYNVTEDKYLIKSAKAATKNAITLLRKLNPKLSITTAVTEGSPKVAILEEAEKFGANLIVVGSHGQGAVAGFLLGSVSQAVALHAKCSVLIVRMKK